MTTRASKREREKARRRWLREQEHRKIIEAEIARLEKQGATAEEICEALDLSAPPALPATRFLMDRLNKIPPDDPAFDDKFKLALVDLIKSDVPLDRQTRCLLAGDLYGSFFPNAKRDRDRIWRARVIAIEGARHEFLHQGMTADEADRVIVETMGPSLGIKTVDALRQRVYRTKI